MEKPISTNDSMEMMKGKKEDKKEVKKEVKKGVQKGEKCPTCGQIMK